MALKPPKINIRGASAGTIVESIIKADKSGYFAGAPSEAQTTAGFMQTARFILAEQNRRNRFAMALVNKIFYSIITSVSFYSEWEQYTEKGVLEDGETIEEIYVGLADPEQYQWTADINETMKLLFGKRSSDIAAAYHSINFEKFYPNTITYTELRKALRSPGQLEELIQQKTEVIYTSYRLDNYIMCKYMLYRLALDGKIYNIQVPEISAETANTAVVNLKMAVEDASRVRTTYTIAGVAQSMDSRRAVVARSIPFSATIDVESLAQAFNLQYMEYARRQITIDGFTPLDVKRLNVLLKDDSTYVPFTDEELEIINSKIYAFIFDEEFFKNYIFLNEVDSSYNGAERYWNYFHHIWKIYGVSPFKTVMMISATGGGVTGVTISPMAVTLPQGASNKFDASVETTGIESKDVIWSISGEAAGDDPDDPTYIQIDGTLHVSRNETATRITVTATSKVDTSKSATATVTVSKITT